MYHKRKGQKLHRAWIYIPEWYRPVYYIIRDFIQADIDKIDDAYQDDYAKADACRIRRILFERNAPDAGDTEASFDKKAVYRGTVRNKLREIEALVSGRGQEYGDAKNNFEDIAHMSAPVNNCKHPAARVALLMILVKVGRLIVNPTHRDSWDDIAGYALCGQYVTGDERIELNLKKESNDD